MLRQNKGFTLIEIIVVMMILVILSAYVGEKIANTANFSLTSTTEQLRRDIRYTQALAMSLNTSYSIVMTSSGYSISPNPPTGAYSVTMPTGISLSAGTITFDSTGAPGSAASVTVTGSGVGSVSFTVTAETGFING